jgi:hypothetical protein
MRSFIPYLRRLDAERYFASQVDLLRFYASLHHPWYDQNPWGRSLRHGQLYRGPGAPGEEFRFFRIVLEFDRDDYILWKQKVRNAPRERSHEAFAIPVRWRWMIEEMQQEKGAASRHRLLRYLEVAARLTRIH